jgi:hypothetical protein
MIVTSDDNAAMEPASAAGADATGPGLPVMPIGLTLDAICATVRKYVVLSGEAEVVVIALWIVHTYVVESFDFTPYLSIRSPEMRCGKTTLLDCLHLLIRDPWSAIGPTEAVLFRKIERDVPTLLLDEVDAIFTSRRDPTKEGLRAILDAGFQRGTKVPRCVGPNHDLKEFGVFCPKAFAGIGTCQGPLPIDRSGLS